MLIVNYVNNLNGFIILLKNNLVQIKMNNKINKKMIMNF